MESIIKNAKQYLRQKIVSSPVLCKNPFLNFCISSYYRLLWASRGNKVNADTLGIENTNICNAACHMCGYRLMKRNKKTMPHSDFCRMIDIAKREGINRVCFGQVGEPLLDKGLIDKIDYMYKNGIELDSITTNGSLLDSGMSRKLLKYPWRMFMFSIDAATKEVYESIRQGLNYEKVTENIRAFLRLRRDLGHSQAQVRLNMVIYQKNQHEEEAFYNIWKGHLLQGKDDIAFLYATDFGGLANIQYSKDIKSRSIRIPCGRLWNNLILVSVTGDIVLCCGDYEADNNIGNIFREGSIKKLWNNAKMQMFRNMHLKGDFASIPACKNCNDNYFIKPYFKVKPV